MSIQRYDIDNAGCSDALMVSDDCGCYVLHEDYAKRIAELEADCDRLRKDKYDLLGVKTKEGMGASEWMMRTATAEARVKELEGALRRIKYIAPTGQGEEAGTLIWQIADGVLGDDSTEQVTADKGE